MWYFAESWKSSKIVLHDFKWERLLRWVTMITKQSWENNMPKVIKSGKKKKWLWAKEVTKTFKNRNAKISNVSYSIIWIIAATRIVPKALFAPNHPLTSINRETLRRLLICRQISGEHEAHTNAQKKNPGTQNGSLLKQRPFSRILKMLCKNSICLRRRIYPLPGAWIPYG